MSTPIAPSSIRIGLRFDRRDTRKLAELADRAKRRELDGTAVSTFEMAADAARTGEPLIVLCNGELEAILMADGYVRFGVRRPSLEPLSGGG